MTGSARAGGFAIPEIGTRRTGMGAVVGRPDDPSAVYHNPAGLTLQPGTRLYISLGVSIPQTDLHLAPWPGSNQYIRAPIDSAGYYPQAQPTRAIGVVPMIVASTNLISDKLWGALSFYVPNATGASFAPDGVTRYHLIDSLLVSGYGTFSLAWHALPWLSIGAGISLIYVQVSADRDLYPILGGQNLAFLLGSDTDLKLAGSDWGWGWNAGLLFQPVKRLTIGATVIGRSDLDIRGPITVTPGQTSNFSNPFVGQQSTALLIPWTFMLGANIDITDHVEIGAEFRYWLYSQWKDQHTDVTGIALLTALDTPENYHDSFHISGGARFHSERLGLEAMLGAHYDASPAPDNTVNFASPSFNHIGLHSALRYSFGPAAGGIRRYRVGLSWQHYWYLQRATFDSITSPPSNFIASGSNDLITGTLEVAFDSSLTLRKGVAR